MAKVRFVVAKQVMVEGEVTKAYLVESQKIGESLYWSIDKNMATTFSENTAEVIADFCYGFAERA